MAEEVPEDRIEDDQKNRMRNDTKRGGMTPCRWKKNVDVDEAVVVVMNVPEKNTDLPHRLIMTLNGPTADSDKKRVRYFFEEVEKHIPFALKYFESRE
jgi:hypothetical protein